MFTGAESSCLPRFRRRGWVLTYILCSRGKSDFAQRGEKQSVNLAKPMYFIVQIEPCRGKWGYKKQTGVNAYRRPQTSL